MVKRNILADYGIESDQIEKEVQEKIESMEICEVESSGNDRCGMAARKILR